MLLIIRYVFTTFARRLNDYCNFRHSLFLILRSSFGYLDMSMNLLTCCMSSCIVVGFVTPF